MQTRGGDCGEELERGRAALVVVQELRLGALAQTPGVAVVPGQLRRKQATANCDAAVLPGSSQPGRQPQEHQAHRLIFRTVWENQHLLVRERVRNAHGAYGLAAEVDRFQLQSGEVGRAEEVENAEAS